LEFEARKGEERGVSSKPGIYALRYSDDDANIVKKEARG
jgi:hypothetical protein